MQQQLADNQRNFSAETSFVTAQSSTQLNVEFRAMEYDISAEKDEFHNPGWGDD